MVAACRPVSTPSPPGSKPWISHALVAEERLEQPDRVGAAAHARGHGVRQHAVPVQALRPRLVADAAGEVADHARERVRSGGGAEEVRRVVDGRDPVAERLVDGVLEGAAAGVDRDDLRAEQAHPDHVERLALHVDRAHVDGAVEAEVRRGGGGGDAVLAGAGLGDHAVLAHPLGEQRLAQHVADLVGAGVVEVLALEQHPAADLLGQPAGFVERAGHVGVVAQDRVELGQERLVGHRVLPGHGELVEGGDQGLGHVAAAEVAEPALLVGVPRCRLGAHRACLPHRPDGRHRVAVLDQGLADQHRAGAVGGVAGDVGGPGDPGLGDEHPVGRHQGRQLGERGLVDVEGLEVAGVDADQLGAQRDRTLGLGLVVHLDQHGQAELAGLVVQPAQVVVGQRRDDEQHEVGAGRAALEELVALDDEVLAQQRGLDRGADRPQVVEAAAEPALLGQHADRGGPARGVRRGERGGVGDVGEVALARAAPLDLGDHADPRRRGRRASGRGREVRRPGRPAGRPRAPPPAVARGPRGRRR